MPRQCFPHVPRTWQGFSCDRPSVHLPVDTVQGTYDVRFILDTGAAITLVPTTLADRLEIVYPDEPAAPNECPRTLGGRLRGHLGQIEASFLGIHLRLPCFFYVPGAATPSSTGPPPTVGPPGQRRRDRKHEDEKWIEEWIDAVLEQKPRDRTHEEPPNGSSGPDESDESDDHPCILGRLGFLNRLHVLIEPHQTTVSTTPFPRPKK